MSIPAVSIKLLDLFRALLLIIIQYVRSTVLLWQIRGLLVVEAINESLGGLIRVSLIILLSVFVSVILFLFPRWAAANFLIYSQSRFFFQDGVVNCHENRRRLASSRPIFIISTDSEEVIIRVQRPCIHVWITRIIYSTGDVWIVLQRQGRDLLFRKRSSFIFSILRPWPIRFIWK